MDFSALNEALAFKSYDKVADICDTFMLQVASEGVSFHEEWPYAIHLIENFVAFLEILVEFVSLAALIPLSVKESQPEVSAAWKIGQRLWIKDYASVHEAIREFKWSPQCQGIVAAFSQLYTKRMFELLLSAYSTISIQDTALFLGMNEDDAANYVLQHGWTVDLTSRMLTVKKQTIATEQKLDPSKLQRLTEYVFHLEH
ncbi:hypothetical protein C2S51_038634 [Perilla frutescens var. frutescens]|nr:hypothetical protein C2S51_038634 [Perilla frutescens var. frutescens]